MQEKIDNLRRIIKAQITDSEQQEDALKLLVELEDYTQKTVSSYELLQNLNHDLRTPIGSIIGFSRVLLDQEISGALYQDQYEDLQVIEKSGQNLLRILNGLMDFAKVKTSSLQVHPQTITIYDFLEKRRPNFQKIVKEKDCFLNLEAYQSDTKISADPWQLYNALKDVLVIASNGGEGYNVELSAKLITIHDKSWLELNIITQGYGIPIAKWEELYQGGAIFQQFGTWEGLALPYELCQLMGGSLQVFRESDSSLRYSLRFPVVEDDTRA